MLKYFDKLSPNGFHKNWFNVKIIGDIHCSVYFMVSLQGEVAVYYMKRLRFLCIFY